MFAWLRAFFSRSGGGIQAFTQSQRTRGRIERSDKKLLEISEQNPNLFSVVDKISTSVARANWRAFRVSTTTGRDRVQRRLRAASPEERRTFLRQKRVDVDELDEIEGHPIIDVLTRGNAHMQGTDVRRLIQWYLEVTGFVFVAVADSKLVGDGEPASIWPFPRFAFQERESTQEIATFRMDGSTWTFPRDRVFAIRAPQPSSPYQMTGSSTGRAVATETSIDENAALTANARLLHDGKPNMLIAAKGASEESIETLQASFNRPGGTAANIGRTHFTNAPMDLTVEKLDDPLADMGLVQLREESGKTIRQTPGVPPEILGRVDNSNRATSQVASMHYHQGVIDPRLAKIEEALNCHLVPMFAEAEGIVIAYDSTIPADVERKMEVIGAFPTEFSRNEKRALADIPATNDPDDAIAPGPALTGTQTAVMFRDVITPYNAGTLSEEQARAALEFVYRVPDKFIASFLVQPEEPVAEDPATADPFAPQDEPPDEDEDENDNPEEEDEEGAAAIVLPFKG